MVYSRSRESSPIPEYRSLPNQNAYAKPSGSDPRASGSYVPSNSGSLRTVMPAPMPGARPGFEYLSQSPPMPVPGGAQAYTAALAYGQGLPGDGSLGYGFDRIAGLGTWSELIAGGVVDRPYIEKEAERRKQEIDRAMDNQLAQLESHCQEQCASIKQQAEYHTQMAEKQIETHQRQHVAQITRQAELQAYAILQKAEMEKGRLGQEAFRALAQESEREKAAVMHSAMRQAEDLWKQSQRALMEQAQRAKVDIDVQAQQRATDIEQQARDAISRVYISPGPLGFGGDPRFSGQAAVTPLGAFDAYGTPGEMNDRRSFDRLQDFRQTPPGPV